MPNKTSSGVSSSNLICSKLHPRSKAVFSLFLTYTLDAYKEVDYLKRHKIDIPEIIEITHLAKKNKNIKIDYFKDVRDIIKDIYKHV